MYDDGHDNVGGFRPVVFTPPNERGRFLWQNNVQDLPEGFVVQTQGALLSDRNFLEQYFKSEFDTTVNQQTYAYVKEQENNWAWTGYASAHLRDWVNETIWLPRADGYIIGQDLFDVLTYTTHASAGYARLMTSTDPEPEISSTDRATNTMRLDWIQEIAYPIQLGPVKVVPYGKLDLAWYSEDLNGDAVGRVWGGGGIRASMPLSRLYPDIQSELLNVSGINHKITLGANYFYAQTNENYLNLPQLDRLNDDTGDQSYRDIRGQTLLAVPNSPLVLPVDPKFDPQTYAIRQLVQTNADTLAAIDVLQLDVFQRWQTKRGYPGMEHIVDWMTLDLSASVFPQANRDNFGNSVAFLQYDWLWNVGDRTALTSTAWVDPYNGGARYFTFGLFLNRSDRTNFYIGYRQIQDNQLTDPVSSKAVIGSVTYVFSPKYAMTATTTYDFSSSVALANSLVMTRIGTDFQVSLGVNYNALQSNFGVVFEIVPNLVALTRTTTSYASVSPGGLFGH